MKKKVIKIASLYGKLFFSEQFLLSEIDQFV